MTNFELTVAISLVYLQKLEHIPSQIPHSRYFLMHDWSGVLSSSHFQSINVLLLGSVKEALLIWTPADRSTVFPFWTPLIDTSKLRGEANVSIVRMAKIRTMKGTIVKQCHSNIQGKTFCITF